MRHIAYNKLHDSWDDNMPADHYRNDQSSGISPPDLTKDATYAEHIVHARGKRTQYTSVSLDAKKIEDFGDTLYLLDDVLLTNEGHQLVTHASLIESLDGVIRDGDKGERQRAVQAKRYAKRRLEALVTWDFDITTVARKDVINHARRWVQKYFQQQ